MNSDEFIASIDEKTGVNIAYLAESGNYAETPEDSFYIRVTSAVDGMIRPDESGIIPPAYVMVTGVSRPSDDVYYIIKNQFFRSSLILVAAAIAMAFTISYFVANPIVQLKNSIPPLAKGKFAFNPKHAWYSEIASLGIVLESVNSEIARTEEIRRGLFANVSHDLRTPLTMVRAYAEKMLDFDDPDTRKEDLNVIVGEVLRLNTLVTDILDISKLESGAEKLNLELFNFSSMLTDIATRFSYLSERNITVVADVSPDILITADRPKIERVIYNLVYNAINYGKPNGNTITLKISADERLNDKLIFQITDNGRGIAEDKLAFIWDRYYKADKSDNHTRLSRGTGLGLSIVKNILELHGYEYGALSEEDVGTTVWFTLPRGDYAAVAKLPF
jgi:signal transduction histidine kinase